MAIRKLGDDITAAIAFKGGVFINVPEVDCKTFYVNKCFCYIPSLLQRVL